MSGNAVAHVLELCSKDNVWVPPRVQKKKWAMEVRFDINALQSDTFFYIFRTEPYIDALYIRYDYQRIPVEIKRFAFHEGYTWPVEDERFFWEHCVKTEVCCNGGALNRIYSKLRKERPEWHLKRYFTHGLRLLDHVYHCLKQNTSKEMLYKAGLDELAVDINGIDRLNLLATKPSEIYDGLSMKVLTGLNCHYGAILLRKESNRCFLRDLNLKFPNLFRERLNDAQCRYLTFLIEGALTVGETGRLFEARRKALSSLWIMSQYDLFMARERRSEEVHKNCSLISGIDPIYEKYIKKVNRPDEDETIRKLEFYLLKNRQIYDRAIRRSNRKRIYDWMERTTEYYIRYPQTINDICREAVYMQHCLLSYADAIAENDTTVLFMRKADDVNQPFITIEIYKGKLMQAYHRFNKDCTPEERDWILAFCKRHEIGTSRFRFNAAEDQLF